MFLEKCERNPIGLYQVQSGDTIASVCSRFGLLPQEVVRRNSCTETLYEGEFLILPTESKQIYTVCVGDTLQSVCQKFSLTESEFTRLNHCTYVYPTQRVYVGKESQK